MLVTEIKQKDILGFLLITMYFYSNGILTEHYMLEVNGQNVVGMKDIAIKQILEASPRTLTITVMPKFVYKHMMDQ